MSKVNSAIPMPKVAATEKATAERGEIRRTVRLLNRFLKGSRGVFSMAMIMLIAESLTTIALKFPLAYLIDYLYGKNPDLLVGVVVAPGVVSPRIFTILILTLSLIVITLLNSMTDSLAEIYLNKGGRRLGYDIRAALYTHLQKLSLAFYSKQRTGDLLTRVTGDVSALEEFATKSLKDIAGSVFALIFITGTLILGAWQVALVAIVMVPLLSVISNYFADRIKSTAKKQRAREGDLAASAQEMLTSIRVIQIFGRGGRQEQRFFDQSQKAMEAALEAGRLQAWFSGVINVLQAIMIAAVVWVGILLVDQTLLTVGTLVLFVNLIQDMLKPTKRIIKEWNAVGKIIASVERINDVIDRKPAVQDVPNAAALPRLKGHVEFQHVSFAYQIDPEDTAKDGASALRLALRDVSFSIVPGEVVALVGPSGAGKSTIVQLLPRLYDPHIGQVLVDGHNIRDFTLDSLRSQMSMVLQEAILFTGTISENITYGRPDATREEIIAAAIQASAHEFIEKLPQGYDTILSERAANLSGGQRQRLAIARAFIRNTPILILDEPTTGLDAESTDLVLAALRTLMKGRTTIIISHDLNLIRNADKIVVIKDGQLAEVGNHKSLLKSGGLYANLYFKQFGEAQAEHDGVQALPAPAAAADVDEEDEDEDAPAIPRGVFETILTQALPRPVSSEAFHTMMMQVLPPRPPQAAAGGAAAPPTPPAVAVASAPPAVAAPPTPPTPSVAAAPPAAASNTPSPFATTLLRALPPELAAQESAPAASGRAKGMLFDPLHSAALKRELPGIDAAFDAPTMREYLQTAFFGKHNPNYTIERCVPGKASYLGGEGCVLRYQLEVRDRLSGQTLSPLVNARLFSNQISCALYLRDHLSPLASLMRGRKEIEAFVAPVTMLEPLNMALCVFPLDGELPTLIGATDRQRMLDVFREILPEAQDERVGLANCRIEIAHYARRSRCVLRYEIDGATSAGRPYHRWVYGKIVADGQAAPVEAIVTSLRKRVDESQQLFQFNIPRLLGYRPDLRLTLMDAVPGVPLIDQLLKSRLAGLDEAEDDLPTLEETLTAAASIAATIHTSAITLGRRHTLDDDLTELRRELGAIQTVAPEFVAQIQGWLRRIETYAEESDPLRRCLTHGNFKHTKLIFDGADGGLVDLDTFCQAEPARDLGYFLAYLRVAARKTQLSVFSTPTAIIEDLCTHFLRSYVAVAGDQLEDEERLHVRVAVHEAVTLLRMVLHSWQVIKVSRIEHVIAVLEERLAALPQLSY